VLSGFSGKKNNKMKKTISALAALFALYSCDSSKQGAFELKGTFSNAQGETIYLEKLMSPNPVAVDSTSCDEKGNFSFSNYTAKIGFYRIKVTQQSFALLILDSADKVTVTGDIKDLGRTYKVTGSPETNLFMEYQTIGQDNAKQTDSLNLAFQAAMGAMKMDSLKMDSLSKIFQPIYDGIMAKYHRALADKMSKNTNSYASLLWLQGLDPSKYAKLYKQVDEAMVKKYPADKMVRTIHESVTKEMATMIGEQAPEIDLLTVEGKQLALSSMKGKVVMIDFWASWCGPCRKEMPFIVKLYDKYKGKGFEIYGVSLDQDKARWEEAIKHDGITWPQVSDLKYWESVAAKQYAVSGIPYTVLLDKEGKILSKGLRGHELELAIDAALEGKPVDAGGSSSYEVVR
jgi:thiol-disulfide isomerase/thioredoxin